MSFLSKIFGGGSSDFSKSVEPLVNKINELEPEFKLFSDEEIKAKSNDFKKRVSSGESLDDILPEAFALVRESAKRTLGQRHYDVQLIGGIALHQGKVAEMRTGEGKTLSATLAIYLNALSGKGAHVVTVNDYLARRDTAWMGQIYNFLGMSVGCINQNNETYVYDSEFTKKSLGEEKEEELDKERDQLGSFKVVHEFLRPAKRGEAYEADITYGTNNEFGFDYLRDNMVYDLSQKSQAKGHNFAIVDEVDSILIDEARTPLIISAPDEDSGKLYQQFARIVPSFKENIDYNVDEKLRAVTITEEGIEKVEKSLGIANIYEEGGVRYVHHLEQALKAHTLFTRDKDYVVKDDEIIIVDEFTGRLMPGRRWSEGLHQAVEAKENVTVQKESKTLATITFQNYFRLYEKLSGMTGTAKTSTEEFLSVYGLDVVEIPTNRPIIRNDMVDRIYKTEAGKFRAVIADVKERIENGQPVLIGTASIQKNELVSSLLTKAGIRHELLNAKNHEREAEIIAQAGRPGAVTVATNMAGRGVDIILGGNPSTPEETKKSKESGGLHVIGTERHEARRIDNQLRGRAGRQGDPGSSQFFVSAEDDVSRIFGGDRLKSTMDTLGVSEDQPIENRFISRAIEQAQTKIEGFHFDSRKHVLQYDDVMNRHRTAIYNVRASVLKSDKQSDFVKEYLKVAIENIVNAHAVSEGYGSSGGWNKEEMVESIKAIASPYEISSNIREEISTFEKSGDKAGLQELLQQEMANLLAKKEEEVGGEESLSQLSKILILRVIDEIWIEHLGAMEHLRDSVRLRAYGQRDPIAEYRIEGQKMFETLQNSFKSQTAGLIFKVGVQQREDKSFGQTKLQRSDQGDSASGSKPTPVTSDKIGRNDPCHCGSGRKYKKCHGK